MEISSLQAFISVADSGSFSQAAEQLFITQPAVSKRIALLESELNSRLFDRIGRRIHLTESGKALLPRARRILMEVEDSRRALDNLSGEIRGTLSIGTSHHIGLHRLPSILREYSMRYPDVSLDLHFMDSEAACQSVEKGELELGIVTLPLEPDPSLQILPVWDDPLSLVSGRDHPLGQKKTLSVRDLGDYPAILPGRGTYTRELLEQALAPLDLELQVSLSTNYLETIKMMVSVGLGWSILPDTMLDDDVQRLALPEIQIRRSLGIVRHRELTLGNAAEALLRLLPVNAAA